MSEVVMKSWFGPQLRISQDDFTFIKIKNKEGSIMFARRSDKPLMFPPCSRYAPPPPVLKVGDRVRIRGCERLGVATVISFDADYRLVRLSFSGMDGWWARMDLVICDE